MAPRQAYEVEVHAHGKNKKVIWSTTFYITKEYESSGRITFAVKGITPERDILQLMPACSGVCLTAFPAGDTCYKSTN